ncbi:hypothetical protein DICPUDRAFT_74146 [Dictyostelium purpureum]|uniref:Tc1-like transposase DDE domain-containing protein n=1 Tax=Dictyostelium purpureum TaxID=5786 RepID=F0Z6X1_DICPU|nr:uncharacterized protein DICPUDRAFT_74146 [Dictyostelium purpureum]EGC40227.1 hypothetical protein DICPUDRAFT_74146 [Dictyostelium purpureum]|eukprot:XP_003283163.1 hypothetical protein DICPUDRAFT_74146 [Dictyostelium purpureum]
MGDPIERHCRKKILNGKCYNLSNTKRHIRKNFQKNVSISATKITIQSYRRTLQEKSILSGDTFFLQENCSIHMTQLLTGFYEKMNIRVIFVPLCAPVLNIMENIWSMVKRRINFISIRYPRHNFNLLIGRILKNIKQDIFDNLYQSIPRKIQQTNKN